MLNKIIPLSGLATAGITIPHMTLKDATGTPVEGVTRSTTVPSAMEKASNLLPLLVNL